MEMHMSPLRECFRLHSGTEKRLNPDLQANYLWDLYKIRRRSITRMEFRRVIRPAGNAGQAGRRAAKSKTPLNASSRLCLKLASWIMLGTIPDDEVKRAS